MRVPADSADTASSNGVQPRLREGFMAPSTTRSYQELPKFARRQSHFLVSAVLIRTGIVLQIISGVDTNWFQLFGTTLMHRMISAVWQTGVDQWNQLELLRS